MVKIMTCYCTHKFQDEKYGKQKRVFNSTKDDGVYRCTVCGKTNKQKGTVMDKLWNANIVQFEQTSIQPLNDHSCMLRTKISDGFFLYQSFAYSQHLKYGDDQIRPTVSFIADGNEGVCAEWEPQYGPIQIWHECSEDWRGKTQRGNPIRPRKHWHYKFVEDNSLEWS